MQDDPQELSVPDVYGDISKNLCNLLASADDEEAPNLSDSLYYTESDFVDFIDSNKIQNESNLTIVSLNIANLLSKLNSFKIFLGGISIAKNKPDVIVVVETHLTSTTNSGLSPHEQARAIFLSNHFQLWLSGYYEKINSKVLSRNFVIPRFVIPKSIQGHQKRLEWVLFLPFKTGKRQKVAVFFLEKQTTCGFVLSESNLCGLGGLDAKQHKKPEKIMENHQST